MATLTDDIIVGGEVEDWYSGQSYTETPGEYTFDAKEYWENIGIPTTAEEWETLALQTYQYRTEVLQLLGFSTDEADYIARVWWQYDISYFPPSTHPAIIAESIAASPETASGPVYTDTPVTLELEILPENPESTSANTNIALPFPELYWPYGIRIPQIRPEVREPKPELPDTPKEPQPTVSPTTPDIEGEPEEDEPEEKITDVGGPEDKDENVSDGESDYTFGEGLFGLIEGIVEMITGEESDLQEGYKEFVDEVFSTGGYTVGDPTVTTPGGKITYQYYDAIDRPLSTWERYFREAIDDMQYFDIPGDRSNRYLRGLYAMAYEDDSLRILGKIYASINELVDIIRMTGGDAVTGVQSGYTDVAETITLDIDEQLEGLEALTSETNAILRAGFEAMVQTLIVSHNGMVDVIRETSLENARIITENLEQTLTAVSEEITGAVEGIERESGPDVSQLMILLLQATDSIPVRTYALFAGE